MLNIANYYRNATEDYAVPLQPVRMASKSLQKPNARERVEKGSPPALLVGMQTGAATMETTEGTHTKSWVPNLFQNMLGNKC